MATERYFVVEITPTVASDGSTSTFLFTNYAGGFATSPTDTPANTKVRGLLRNPGSLRREIFSGARVTGAITPAYGNIVLANPAPEQDAEGLLDDWLDYSVAGARIVVRWGEIGAAYPSAWTTVYIAYGHSMIADLNEITIRLRDRLQVFDKPVVADGFTGAGGLEGTGGIAKRKQVVIGDPGFIPPILVDASKQIYFVQSSGTGGLHYPPVSASNPSFRVYDNGVEITRDLDYSSAAQLLSTEPDEGEVRFWFGGVSGWNPSWQTGPVYFRLGSPPDGDLRVFAHGYPTDADCNALGLATASFSLRVVAVRVGLARSDIDQTSRPGATLSLASQLIDDDRSWLEVLSEQCLCYHAWFGFDRLDKLRSGYLLDPESQNVYHGISDGVLASNQATPSTSVYTFTPDKIMGLRREPVAGMEAPIWSIRVTAGDTWPSQLAGGATATMKDYLSREAWTSCSAVSTSTLLANPGAGTAAIRLRPRAIQNVFGARLFAERYFALYGGRRDFYTFTVPLSEDVLALDLHDCVTLQVPRFGLSAGRKHRIVGMTIDCGAPRGPVVRFTLWGGVTGQMTGFNGGPGSVPSTPTGPPAVTANPAIALDAIGQFTGVFAGSVETTGGGAEGDTTDEDATSGSEVATTRASIGLFTGVFIGEVTAATGLANAIAVSFTSTMYSSDGGETWASNGAAPWNDGPVFAAANGSTVVVAAVDSLGYAGIWSSANNGTTWTRRHTDTSSVVYGLAWTGSKFVALFYSPLTFGRVTSTDGITWSTGSVATLPFDAFELHWNGSVLIAAGLDGPDLKAYTSSNDGSTWSLVYSDTTAQSVSAIGSGGGVTVLGSNDNVAPQVRVSDDLAVWDEITATMSDGATAIAYGNGLFVMTRGATCVKSSDLGQTWSSSSIPTGLWTDIKFTGTKFVAISTATNYVATSTDGNSWSARSATGTAWYALAVY